MINKEEILLDVKNLSKHFPIAAGVFSRKVSYLKAVDGVSFFINKGETLGVVGESGCGKTTTGRVILRLLEPTSGTVHFEGKDVLQMPREEVRKLRRDMQIIFQDPFSSLNPRMKVSEIIGEPISIHHKPPKQELEQRVRELIEIVGLNVYHLPKYPHEFSGGQRQRIGIARALALSPKLIVCDEPVSALDVSIQSQIINLLQDLQKEFNLTYMFIAHDLSVVKHISDRIAVMYLGKIVEMCSVAELFEKPLHPYTQALLSAIPVPDPEVKAERIILTGDIPNAVTLPEGCRFHTRCNYKMKICTEVEPSFLDIGNSHFVSCHLTAI